MAHERGELVEPRRGVKTFSIPPQQAPHGEGVPQAVQVGRRDAVRDRERQLEDEPVECQARGAGMHAAPTVEGEQRCVRFSCTLDASAFDLTGEEIADARPVGDQTALAELATTHDQELPVGVDVAEAEAARLPGSQPQAVACLLYTSPSPRD